MIRRPPGRGAACALALASLATAACLPRGNPPAGRQILADRNAALMGLVNPNGDGVLRVLFFRPGKDADNVDLWVLSVAPDGSAPVEKLLLTDLDSGIELSDRPQATSYGFGQDARGRVFLTNKSGLFRVDPVTGETLALGAGYPGSISASGQRVLIQIFTGGSSEDVLCEADGSMSVIDGSLATFVGDTVLYQSATGDLMRIPPGGAAQPIAAGVTSFNAVNDNLLLLTRAIPDPTMPAPSPDNPFSPLPAQVTASLLDLTTLVETPLPVGPLYQYGASFSPDDRWILTSQASQDGQDGQSPTTTYGQPPVLVDTVTGTIEPLPTTFAFIAGWRPGHDELWASAYDPNQTGQLSDSSVSIKRPGQPVVTIPGVYLSGFSGDGAYWFSRGAPFSAAQSSDLVGVADAPAGPRFPAVPNGSSLSSVWSTGDGRLVTTASVDVNAFDEFFVQVVDPRTGASQLLGERGYLSAVGQTRALGLYHMSYLRGDLTSTDFTTGRSTVLASEFAMWSVVEPLGADACPPGGRIVYQFQSRFDSPWDGLWLATVP